MGKDTYAYQWRDYDPAIGRFNKIDRFAELYDPLSPYSFTANNPIVFREIKGDSLKVGGHKTDVGEFTNEVNKGLGGFYDFEVDDNGNASLTKTSQSGKLTKQQKKFYKGLKKVIKNKKTTNVSIVSNDANVEIGSYDSGQIDIADVKDLGSSDLENPQAVSSQGAIAHEISEQFSKQVKNKSTFSSAHPFGLSAERSVNGTGRKVELGAVNVNVNDSNGNPRTDVHSLSSIVRVGSTERRVDIIIIGGNVSRVDVNDN